MRTRWISALVGIPVFLGICVWNATPFRVGICCVALLALTEMLTVYRRTGRPPNPLLTALGLLAPAAPFANTYLLAPLRIGLPELLLAGVLLALLWEVVQAARTGEVRTGQSVGQGLLCGLYIALFFGLPSLRDLPEPAVNALLLTPLRVSLHLDFGASLVLLTVFCVWATDSFAFFVGRAFGRRKLAPKLSPGKTVEGAFGGLVASLLVGALFGHLLLNAAGWGLAVGSVAGILGQAGDLFESALKREAGVKDFGSLMPGHGGALDRFDSLLFVAPAVGLLFSFLLR